MSLVAIGFNQGQYGDLCMSTVAARSFKRDNPNVELVLGKNKKYESIKDLFLNNDFFDRIQIWDGYDNWPTESDRKHMMEVKYHKVFNPMPIHTEPLWYLERHQTQELCLMHELVPPEDLRVSLRDYFSTGIRNYIAICLSGVTRGESKSLTLESAKALCSAISKKFGIKVYQIGLPEEPLYADERFSGSFLEVAKFVLESKLLVSVDTSWSWIASGYEKSVVGLYSSNYYFGAKTAKNWQPINRNAIYLESENVNDINSELVLNEISRLL